MVLSLGMEFPVYACHKDYSVFYQIISKHHFIEKKRLGAAKFPLAETYMVNEIRAEDYSTALYILDLLHSIEKGELISCTASEFLARGNPHIKN